MNLANHFRHERAGSSRCQRRAPARTPGNDARQAFTMMEIAISLAIIGIALVAIIGVLPIGMNAQQDNRQETIIGQDASVLVEDIRNAALGANDLTNYIYLITNSWVEYNPANNTIVQSGGNGYTYNNATIAPNYYIPPAQAEPLTNAANIIGLLSTPEFTDQNGYPTANIFTNLGLPDNGYYYSNHIVAYVYSISGPAYEKPPQDNALMQQDSFGYRVFVVNTTQPLDPSYFFKGVPNYNQQMLSGLHELRLTFLWPQSPNGNLGSGRQTFRTLVAGQLLRQPGGVNNSITYNPNEYFYQPQSFANTP